MSRPSSASDREALVGDARRALIAVQEAIAPLDLEAATKDAVGRAVTQLDDPFLLVIIGEFNAGKSALINALLGARVLIEGVTPTTARIGVLRHGDVVGREPHAQGYDVVTAPLPLLQRINIVDTPGTNAVLREHEALTRHFVPRADLVLFVTSADRPFTESERSFVEAVRAWGKPVLVAINKVDVLETAADRATIEQFVRTHATTLLGRPPEVFLVSARQALRAKSDGDAAALDASGVASLERFIEGSLDDRERFRLKLLNPIGVADRAIADASTLVDDRLGLLRDDVAAVQALDDQLRLHQEDVQRDLRFRLADIDNALLDFEKRGERFFDETLRLTRLPDLLNRHRIAEEFRIQAVADLPERIEERVEAIVGWMAESELRLWRTLSEQLRRREAAHAERGAGRIDSAFESSHSRLLQSVRREANRAIETYDQAAEARRLAESVRDAVAGAALLQASAVGLGALVTAVASTTVADVTGLLAAGVLSVIGFLVLPAKRRAARHELEGRVAQLRETLMTSLSAKTHEELAVSVRRIEEAVAPYTRFVRAERDRLETSRRELEALRERLIALRTRADAS